ncbi:MAG: helix-turn-helix domain-containing protein [Rhodanobacteraceae bacterium]|nr:helix-turn-helix domain-containing protein [Rhodanobacteraceae bacterium]
MTKLRVLLNPREAADYLRTTVGTLKAWRHQERGPLFERSGRRVLYDLGELDTYLAGERSRGEYRAMTPAPPRPKVATLADVLPADVWEFIRETALQQRTTPADLIRQWATDVLVRRIVSYPSEGWDGPEFDDRAGAVPDR